jgi:hypothetical protein
VPNGQQAADNTAPDNPKAALEKTDKLAMTSDGPKLAT